MSLFSHNASLSFSKISTLWNMFLCRGTLRGALASPPLAAGIPCRSRSTATETHQSEHDRFTSPLTPPPSSSEATPTNTPPAFMSDSSEYSFTAPNSHVSPSFMNDPLSMKFINCMMKDGKKSISQTIFKKTLEIVKSSQLKKLHNKADSSSSGVTVETDPLVVFHTALKNVTPLLGTKPVKRGGRTYQVPAPLHENRRRFLSIKWLITAARERPGPRRTMKMPERLAAEIIDAYNNQGTAVKRKQDMNRLAEANRAYVHFRW